MIALTLPYPISANRYWNSFPLGKRIMTAPSSEAKKYKREVARIARAAGITEPIRGRVHVDIKLYPARPQDWTRRAQKNPLGWDDDVRCIDLDNARKCLYDAMKNVVFEDDRWVWEDTGKRMEPDGGEARVVVTITKLHVEPVQPSLIEAYVDGVRIAPRAPELPAKPF